MNIICFLWALIQFQVILFVATLVVIMDMIMFFIHMVLFWSTRDLGVSLSLRCDIPNNTHAVNMRVNLPMPKTVTR